MSAVRHVTAVLFVSFLLPEKLFREDHEESGRRLPCILGQRVINFLIGICEEFGYGRLQRRSHLWEFASVWVTAEAAGQNRWYQS